VRARGGFTERSQMDPAKAERRKGDEDGAFCKTKPIWPGEEKTNPFGRGGLCRSGGFTKRSQLVLAKAQRRKGFGVGCFAKRSQFGRDARAWLVCRTKPMWAGYEKTNPFGRGGLRRSGGFTKRSQLVLAKAQRRKGFGVRSFAKRSQFGRDARAGWVYRTEPIWAGTKKRSQIVCAPGEKSFFQPRMNADERGLLSAQNEAKTACVCSSGLRNSRSGRA